MFPPIKPNLCQIISRTTHNLFIGHGKNCHKLGVSLCIRKFGHSISRGLPLGSVLGTSFFNKYEGQILLATSSVLPQPKRGYAMRLPLSEYGIIWRRPEYVPSWRPEKSGDLKPFEELDKERAVLAYKCVEKEILQADERVKKLFSLDFSSEKEVLEMAKYMMLRRIQQHQFDTRSFEVKIAMMTVEIRFLQIVVANSKPGKKIKTRVRCQELIDRRKRKLKHLRRYDYKKFEWLIEELGILYRPYPRYYRWITRKISLRQLVRMHCKKLMDDKLAEYRLQLETMKKPFLEEKKQTLQWIAETERKLGLPVSVEVPEEPKQLAAAARESSLPETEDNLGRS